MNGLIDLLNELAEKYNMDENDVKRIQEKVFKLETAEDALDGDANAQDFVVPEDNYEDGEEEE